MGHWMAQQVKYGRGVRGLLIGVAIGGALLALPGQASAVICTNNGFGFGVTPAQCTSTGGTVQSNGGGGLFCAGGNNSGVQVCNGSGGGGSGSGGNGNLTGLSQQAINNVYPNKNNMAPLLFLLNHPRELEIVTDILGDGGPLEFGYHLGPDWNGPEPDERPQGIPGLFPDGSLLTGVTGPTPPSQGSSQSSSQSSSHLGMYVSSGTPSGWSGGAGFDGSGSVLRSSGYGVTDSTGAIAPGTVGPSVRDVIGSGGMYGTYDASRLFGLVSANQSFVLGAFVDYRHDDTSLGAAPGFGALPLGNSAALNADTYTFGGAARYRSGPFYLTGLAGYSFGQGNEIDNLTPAIGGFGLHGYFVDARLGEVFVLMGGAGAPNSTALPTKAPPKGSLSPVLALDLSGHIGYSEMDSGGFSDSSGFIYGPGKSQSGDVGARARLFALMPASGGWLWTPYVSATFDQGFGVSNTLSFPDQAALPGGDIVSLLTATTYWGSELGLDVRAPNGLIIGIKGFYQASADTTIAGGSAFVKIPLIYTPNAALAARY
jgi:hypothetical protein